MLTNDQILDTLVVIRHNYRKDDLASRTIAAEYFIIIAQDACQQVNEGTLTEKEALERVAWGVEALGYPTEARRSRDDAVREP